MTEDKLVSMIVSQRAPLMIWNGQLYVVYRVVYVRNADLSTLEPAAIYIRKFLLWDTRFSDSRRTLVFDRQTEDPPKGPAILTSGLERLRAVGTSNFPLF